MTEKRYTIKPQDDLFGVVDNYSADKICVINGIRTEIEAEWLCKDMNALNDENEELKQLLDYADDLIQSQLSEHHIRQWRNFKTGHKEYNDFWEEKLKKHKELNEDLE